MAVTNLCLGCWEKAGCQPCSSVETVSLGFSVTCAECKVEVTPPQRFAHNVGLKEERTDAPTTWDWLSGY